MDENKISKLIREYFSEIFLMRKNNNAQKKLLLARKYFFKKIYSFPPLRLRVYEILEDPPAKHDRKFMTNSRSKLPDPIFRDNWILE